MREAVKPTRKAPQTQRKPRNLRFLGFHRSAPAPAPDDGLDPPEIGDNGKSLTREWAQMDAEAEDCRRNGAFSYSRE
jgi:hypothetical protein